MILDGNQRGGARDLAIHLMKPENEHIELHEIRGFMADTIMGALREAEAICRGTKCVRHLYSLSLSPPETANVPVSAFEDAVQRIEEKLGLAGHPRVIVFHEKNGRRHAHCIWSRINVGTMTAVRMSHDRRKLADISRQLYLEHGWKMPEGLIDPDLRNPFNFDRKEWFQAKRAGKDPRDIKNALQQCWAASDSGPAFRSALEARGYWLAQGDRRAVVAIDINGEIYAVARWIGLKTRDVVSRTNDIVSLPSVAEVRGHVSRLVREKMAGFVDSVTEEFIRAAQALESQRIALVEQQRKARRELHATQEIRAIHEGRQRAKRFRKGILGLWDRVTGKQAEIRKENELATAASARRDNTERHALISAQLLERKHLQGEIAEERRAHVRQLAQLYREIGVPSRDVAPAESSQPKRRRRHRHSWN
ncbi:relaxase/mobilization nuclease domain-containing protein [Neoaquamicrobium sediminum]|uniref:relaxase/mobilization nuclease domain-containing protein n=1 Tax=Neoaquamicrobium sediminum TaxID=1849104 RepID=UPI003BAA6D8E